METQFKAGDLAQIKSTGEVVTINAVSPGLSQMFYLVFQNGKKNRYKASELTAYVDKEESILSLIGKRQFSNAEAFQKYAYYRLFSENQERNIYSYQGNKIIFNPFQYKPLMKFLSIDSDERLLIADEVGVGKTIETGIILDELLARGELRGSDPVMIVCPSILSGKWRAELRTKFLMDDFYIHDGKSLSFMLKDTIDTGRVQYPHSIVSEQLFRGEKYQNLLREAVEENGEPIFKLLIVDECHHYRNPGTNTHKTGMLLSLASERVIMLSATPYNLRSDDLYNQLHILNPALFSEEEVFHQLLHQIRNVNQAIMLVKKDSEEAAEELKHYASALKPVSESNPYIMAEYARLYDKIMSGGCLDVKDRVDFERIAEMLNPIATSFTRTLKKDAIDHRVTRETMTLEVHYLPEEAELYNAFLDVNLQRYQMLGISEKAFGLILNGLERIAASSLIALEKNVNRFLNMSDEDLAEMFSADVETDTALIHHVKKFLEKAYKELLGRIRLLGDRDSKYETLRQLIGSIRKASPENPRIIVFSFYTETLKYLRRRLSSDGYRIALMYGKTPDETPNNQSDEDGFRIYGRNDIMKAFEAGEYDILLVSEVGGEGLDFQFCSALINYDLPYNPMRIEQRIGRIDRMGQKADKIIIGNLCIENTIDMVINRVLMTRIADAADLVGELEPIIAKELAEINELIITREFSAEDIRRRERELEQRIEKEKQTRQEFEEARYELVNDRGFREEFEDLIRQSRITPHESLLYAYSFLKKENGCWCKPITETAASVHISREICDRMRAYRKKMNLGKAGEEIKYLLENNGELIIDFDGDAAYENRDRVFFKPAGAFIRFLIDYMRFAGNEQPENVFYCTLKSGSVDGIDPGRYWMFVYDMEFRGFTDLRSYEYVMVGENGMKIITLGDEQKKSLFQEVKNGRIPGEISMELFDDICMRAEEAAESRKEEISNEAKGKNSIKIDSRIKAIQNLSDLRIRELEDELIGAPLEGIEKKRKKIDKERRKAEERIRVLKEKMEFVGTYAIDSISLIDVK